MRSALCAWLVALPIAASAAPITLPPPAAPVALPKGQPVRAVQFSRLVLKLTRGATYGRVAGNLLCVSSTPLVWKRGKGALEASDLDDTFKEELERLGFDVVGASGALFDEDGDRRAEYLVGGTIKDLFVDACLPRLGLGDGQSAKGVALFDIDWQIYSRLERKVVGRFSTRTGVTRRKTEIGGVDGLILGGFAENVRALAASGVLQRHLLGAPSDPDAVRRPGDLEPIRYVAARKGAGDLQDAIGATVVVTDGTGHGSGFLISSDGLFLTNRHVVGGAKYVKLIWSDKVETLGEVVRVDKGRDVALVRSQARNRAPLRIAAMPDVGASVYAIGAPLDRRLQNSVTRGIVSAVRVLDGYQYIQSDATVLPGNSGGPLVTDKGDVVGMTVSGIEVRGAPQGLNLFIPIDEAISFLGMKPAS